jgi:hypothetical protein
MACTFYARVRKLWEKCHHPAPRNSQPPDTTIRHFGTLMGNLHIVAMTGGKAYDCGPTPCADETLVRERLNTIMGEPFFGLPGRQPLEQQLTVADEEIVGYTEGGCGIPRRVLEMVYNDALMLEHVHGDGTFATVASHMESAVLKVARELYLEGKKKERKKKS